MCCLLNDSQVIFSCSLREFLRSDSFILIILFLFVYIYIFWLLHDQDLAFDSVTEIAGLCHVSAAGWNEWWNSEAARKLLGMNIAHRS